MVNFAYALIGVLCLSNCAAETDWETLNTRAIQEAQKGEWDKALATAEQSLAIKQSSVSHHLISQIALVHSQYDKALVHIKKAFEIDPTPELKSQVKFHEAVIKQNQKDFPAALAMFKESIEILVADKALDAKSLEKVAIATAALGDIPSAVGYLKQLWKIAPQYQFHNGLPFVRITDQFDEQLSHAGAKGQRFADALVQDLSNITAVTDRVYMDVTIDAKPAQRIVIGLHGKAAPKAVRNFIDLATCSKGPNVCYKGTKFHRIVKDFIIQAGDIHPGDGTGRVNSYGRPFGDDVYGLALMHDGPGIVQMANAGPDTNGGQFVVMANAAAHLNGNHVVLGRVLEGMEVVTEANNVEVDAKHFPKRPVVITSCGLL